MAVSYKYKAVDAMGRVVEYTHQANTKEEVLKMIREKGFTPIRIQAEEQQSKDLNEISRFEGFEELQRITEMINQKMMLQQ